MSRPPTDDVFGREDTRTREDYEVKGNLLAARPRYFREQWGACVWRATWS